MDKCSIIWTPRVVLLAAYGGVFVAGPWAWGMIFDGFRPDRWDTAGSVIRLLGVAVIMFAPRNVG